MIEKLKEKFLPAVIGLFLTFVLTALLYFNLGPFQKVELYLENFVYDLQVRKNYKPVSKDIPIAIVDINDKSLKEIGRWPWPRKTVADLVDKLFNLGVSVIAFDISFAEPEKNIVTELEGYLQEENKSIPELNTFQNSFDFDVLLANSLQKGPVVLSYFFTNEGPSSGFLPPPLPLMNETAAKGIFIPSKKYYISNIPVLQNAGKNGGFFNSTPDFDGIHRFAPLLMRNQDQLYPSLGLQAARLFLSVKQAELVIQKYENGNVLGGIRFENRFIPTDPYGRILIPFRGPPYSLPYISAADVLQGSVKSNDLKNKLVFIGSSATALGDWVPVAIAPDYPGVEIHADIASGIIDNYLPFRPVWSKGVANMCVLALGIFTSLIFPLFGLIGSSILSFLLSFGLLAFNRVIWVQYMLDLGFFFPILIIWIVYLFNLIWAYAIEREKRQKALGVFGQYVPPERIATIMKTPEALNLSGETKELTVLFTDIRGFTALSEKMSSQEIKQLLNVYLTKMTQVIFDHKGTIDKYVGDLIMAFWGAPLDNPQHAFDAVCSALDMKKALQKLNEEFRKAGHPEIHTGIGVNTGMMNVGDMGSKFRRAYTVLGDSVNLASRLESICRVYDAEIIVGEETYRQAKERFAWMKLDRVQVKGKNQAIDIYQPLCQIEQCSKEDLELAEKHAHGMELYLEQHWDEAIKQFEELKEKNPSLYSSYLERIKHFKAVPPASDWTGVFIIDSK